MDVEIERGGFGRDPHLAQRPRDVALHVLQLEHEVAERIAAQLARRTQRFHKSLERHVLVRQRVEDGPLDAHDELLERQRVVKLLADHERVDEEADEVLDFLAVAPGHRNGRREVAFAAVAAQLHQEAGQKDGEQRDAMLAAEAAQRAGQRGRELELLDAAGEAGLVGTRPVGRHVAPGQVDEFVDPVIERGRAPVRREVLALPGRIVAVLQRQRGRRGPCVLHRQQP